MRVDNIDADAEVREKLIEALLYDNQDTVIEAHISLALERVASGNSGNTTFAKF